MLSRLVLVVGLGWLPWQAATSAPQPAAHVEGKVNAVKENPAITALVLKIYSQMRTGKVDETLLTDMMNSQLSPMVLALERPIFDQLGNPVKLTLESSGKTPYGTRWIYLVVFPTAQMHVSIYMMSDGKVGGYELSL